MGESREVKRLVSRRAWLAGGGIVAGAGVVAYTMRDAIASYIFTRYDNSAFEPSGVAAEDSAMCMLTASSIEGPFYVENSPLRSDVREDRVGALVRLKLRIVDGATCQAIAGAKVVIWHADALGNYSGHDDMDPSAFPFAAPYWEQRKVATPTRYLRGHQVTDAEGLVSFQTIYPGWYTPRTPHIHVKAIVADRDVVSAQLFFPQGLTDEIAKAAPYNSRGPSPYTNANDFVIAETKGAPGAWPKTSRSGDAIEASLTIGIKGLS